MEPKFITLAQLNLVGFSFYGDPFRLSPGWSEENEIGRLWTRFMAYVEQYQERMKPVAANVGIAYEVHIYNEETITTGLFEVFVGVELADITRVPIDMVIKVLPSTQYAVFTLQGEAIVSDWPQGIYQEWLPNSKYELAHDYHIQYHDGSFKGLDQLDVSSLDVYVPVKPHS